MTTDLLMSDVDPAKPQIQVGTIVVVRVSGPVDAVQTGHLARILDDLISNHGVRELMIDLSAAEELSDDLVGLLDDVQVRVASQGGVLELRLPSSPPTELANLAEEVPTFTPFEA